MVIGLFLGLCLLPADAPAEDAVPRKVLVLLDREGPRAHVENLVYESCQTILNYYGVLPEYRSVNAGPLPSDEAMSGFRGVITAFTQGRIEDPDEFLSWLLHQMKSGRKVIVLGSPGVGWDGDPDSRRSRLLAAVYGGLGLRHEGDFTAIRSLLRYVKKGPSGVEFEREYPAFPPVYERFVPTAGDLHVFLSIQRTDRNDSESAVVVTGPGGGFAMVEFIRWQDPVTYRKQWYIDPFLFFRESLGLARIPAPDPTTLNGVRVAVSHVDGDAFGGRSRIEGTPLCAEVIRDRVLTKFDFPVTVSVIVGEVAPEAIGNDSLMALARSIFSLPNVEPASHSYSHPFYWNPEYAGRSRYHRLHGIVIPGYEFDPAMEIDYSVEYINRHLAPPEKPCRVFLWTGNCEPRASDVARCDELGILNMNGGDTIFDDIYDSYTSVAPYVRNVGGRYQVHTGQANENILTNLWEGPHQGFRNIITTMERTGSPRRIAPIDIYYHFYSAEYPASLKALEDVYTWVLKQETARMFTSDYLRMVRGYLDAEIRAAGPGRYEIHHYGECTTVRFEDTSLRVDPDQCEHVLGWVHEPRGLFVSLAPDRDRAVIQVETSDRSGSARVVPHLRKAGGRVDGLERGEKRITLRYGGFGTGFVEIGGLEPNRIHAISGSAVGTGGIRQSSDSEGILSIPGVTTGTLDITW